MVNLCGQTVINSRTFHKKHKLTQSIVMKRTLRKLQYSHGKLLFPKVLILDLSRVISNNGRKVKVTLGRAQLLRIERLRYPGSGLRIRVIYTYPYP
jgi:hypothetical protein